jgi:antitoxin VapB
MLTAKVFTSGNSQAVRIPKELRTDKKEFIIRKMGDGYMLLPKDDPWFAIRESMGKIPDDFMNDREQPRDQERDF